MQKTLNKIILSTMFSFVFVFAANAQNFQTERNQDVNTYHNYSQQNQNYWNNRWNNLPNQVYSFIESRWGNYTSNEQKIFKLRQIVQFLNQKIAILERGGGGPGQGRDRFSAYPTSGRAPLGVTFLNYYSGQANRPTIDYGDGTHEQASVCNSPRENYCTNPGRNSHVYRNPGTYTARLVESFCPRGTQCFASEKVLDTVVIRVDR